jgi:hypothetical protein
MSFWTELRDTLESGAVLAGNYILPGSALVTKNLVSEGSKNQLNSTVGQLAMLGTGVGGGVAGNLDNYGAAYDKVAGLFGGSSSAGVTGQQAVDAFNAGKISAAEFEAIANGAGTTSQGLLSGAGGSLTKYLTPAAILASGMFGANAAQKAATTQAEAQSQANQLLYSMYKEQQGLQEPWRQAGLRALPKVEQISSEYKPFTMNEMYQDPGYAFRLSEGQKALERSAAARGGLLSGSTGKNLERFGQEMGSQEYNAARNRYIQDYQNRLSAQQTLAGYGTGATNALAAAAGQYGTQAGAGLTNIGAAQAAGQVGQANALTGALGTGLNYMASSDLANALRQSGYRNPYAMG